jgi:SNF2 family DNA or RNA helicase
MQISLDATGRIIVTGGDLKLVSGLPDRHSWSKALHGYVAAPSRVNFDYLASLAGTVWTAPALAACEALTERTRPAPILTAPHVFADPPPYPHQREAFERSVLNESFALLMEQRTGKTRVAIDTAVYHHLNNGLQLAVVICPNSVKGVWLEEIATWVPHTVEYRTILYTAGTRNDVTTKLSTPFTGLTFLVLNADALSTDKSYQWLRGILTNDTVKMALIDEASAFKSPTSSRSKHLIKLRHLFQWRRILTGTLVTQGPMDVFIPFGFLEPAIIGYSSFTHFRDAYAVLGGFRGKQIIAYTNVEKLANTLAPFSYRKLRRECVSVPEKTYTRVEVTLSPAYRKAYDSMCDQLFTELEGYTEEYTYLDENGLTKTGTRPARVSTTMILTQLLRLQQIVGGFLPMGDDGTVAALPGHNPKLDVLLEQLEEESGKIVIWCRFIPEIRAVSAALRQRYGDDAVVEFHGAVRREDRDIARARFQTDGTVRFFVGQQQTGGLGIRLDAASAAYYFSNLFSLEAREQTEDRGESLDRDESLHIIDLIAVDTVDEKIVKALRGKKKIAALVNRDNIRDWI